MAYVYPGAVSKRKVERKEYSKIIEWLYNLSKNENTWWINKWGLRKKDLEQLNLILRDKNISSDEIKLIKNYVNQINLKVGKIDSIVTEYYLLHDKADKLFEEYDNLAKKSISELNKEIELSDEMGVLFESINLDYDMDNEPDTETKNKLKTRIDQRREQFKKYMDISAQRDMKSEEYLNASEKEIDKHEEFDKEVIELTGTLKELCELYQTITKK